MSLMMASTDSLALRRLPSEMKTVLEHPFLDHFAGGMYGLLSAEVLIIRGVYQLRRSCASQAKGRTLYVQSWASSSRSLSKARIGVPGGNGDILSRSTHTWSTKPPINLQRAAAFAVEVRQSEHVDTTTVQGKAAKTGAFQSLPIVPPADEHLRSALKRASRVSVNKSIKNEAQQARNLCARQLDAITKEIAVPLGRILKGFPSCSQLHPFERALLDLTIGVASYEKRLGRVDALRKSSLEVGKAYAARASKAANKKEAKVIMQEGFEGLETFYRKHATAVDGLKDMAKTLRRLPTVDPATPTVALVGAPNVGKSSLVQVLSSGLPEVCNYPFTTRTVKMGHFFVDGIRHQVTDTPGLLNRKDADRNAMERLTVACLQHLPTTVLFVIDLTGECGTAVHNQWAIRSKLRANFPDKPWLDVFSKADLLDPIFMKADESRQSDLYESEGETMTAIGFVRAVGGALRVSSTTEAGIPGLKACVLASLSQQRLEI